jgi:hypothetical protein
LVYNIGQAPPAAVGQAETEAGRILGEAGLRAVWIDCLDRHSADARKGLCGKAREPVDVVLMTIFGPSQEFHEQDVAEARSFARVVWLLRENAARR